LSGQFHAVGYSRRYDWRLATGALMKITGLRCVSLLLGAAAGGRHGLIKALAS
jgi:hypothetical protein